LCGPQKRSDPFSKDRSACGKSGSLRKKRSAKREVRATCTWFFSRKNNMHVQHHSPRNCECVFANLCGSVSIFYPWLKHGLFLRARRTNKEFIPHHHEPLWVLRSILCDWLKPPSHELDQKQTTLYSGARSVQALCSSIQSV
jgi:hypothetical protein